MKWEARMATACDFIISSKSGSVYVSLSPEMDHSLRNVQKHLPDLKTKVLGERSMQGEDVSSCRFHFVVVDGLCVQNFFHMSAQRVVLLLHVHVGSRKKECGDSTNKPLS